MEPRDEPPRATITLGVSEAAIIAVSTGFAYCLAFTVSFGQAAYLGVPTIFIRLETAQLVTIAVACFLVFGFPALYFMSVGGLGTARFSNISRRPLGAAFIFPYNIAYCSTLLALVTGDRDRNFLIQNFAFPAVIIVVCLSPVIYFALILAWRHGGLNLGLLNRFLRRLIRGRWFMFWMTSSRGILYFVLLNAAFFILCSTAVIGYVIEENRQDHYIVSNGPYAGYVVTWMAGEDFLVLQSYNKLAHLLSCDMVAVKVDADHAIGWNLVRTGRLDNVYSNWKFASACPSLPLASPLQKSPVRPSPGHKSRSR